VVNFAPHWLGFPRPLANECDPASDGVQKSLREALIVLKDSQDGSMVNKEKCFYEFGPFRIDLDHRLLLREGRAIPLQSKAFDVLLVLVQNGEQVVLKDDLMKAVWPQTFVEESNMAQHIFVLRKALGDAVGENRYIITVPGRGYRFTGRVQVVGKGGIVKGEDSLVVESHTRSRLVVEERGVPINVLAPKPWSLRRFVVFAALLALVVATAVAVHIRRTPRLTDKDTIVLADFDNKTGDPDFSDALRQGLSAQLEQSPFLNLLPDQRVAQTLSLMTQPKDTRLTHELALEVCRRTASAAVLNGAIAQVGNRYLLTLKAINCSSGESLASSEGQATDKDHILDALGMASSEIRRKVGESLASVQKYDAPPEDVTTSSLQALQAYSLGYRTMIAKNDRAAAIPLFQRAISLDPSFAMAYARLGITFFNLDEPSRAEESLRKAYDLRERLSQREKLYVAASFEAMAKGNMEEARKSYELWHQIYPRDPFAVGNLGVIYGYLGDCDRALVALQEAWKLNQGNALVFSNIVATYLQLNRFGEARAFASKAKDLHLESMALHDNLYVLDFLQHDAAGMEREANELIGKPGWDDLMLYHESDTAAYEGHFSSARALTRRAVDSAIRADKSETAAAYESESAVREALVGNSAVAQRQANAALALSHGKEVEALAAIARGLAGDSFQAARLSDDLNQRFPEDTSVQFNFLPTIRAASALQNGHGSKAKEALDMAQPYELGATTQEVSFYLYPVYLRAGAYLAEKQGTVAAAEFRKILDHPGLVQNEPIGALAHLGLGRAHALTADTGKAKAEYEEFLSLWKDADSDIPILKQAKAEYAKLH
jgi:eukaryotic-like serine/threonine-protein kinase